MACSSALGPGTTSTTCVRFITGRITSAACGIRIASMTATGSLSAMRGSMSGNLENSASIILTADAGLVKCGNFTDAILIAGGNSAADEILTVGVGSGKVASSMIGAGDMSAAKVVDGSAEDDKKQVG